jgi:hypothetical protein
MVTRVGVVVAIVLCTMTCSALVAYFLPNGVPVGREDLIVAVVTGCSVTRHCSLWHG